MRPGVVVDVNEEVRLGKGDARESHASVRAQFLSTHPFISIICSVLCRFQSRNKPKDPLKH